MKACTKCGARKPLNDFYQHAKMADGCLSACKECVKERVRKNRAERAEYYKAFDRARAWLPERVLARKQRQERAKRDHEMRQNDNKAKRRWYRQNAIKKRCNTMVARAIKAGTLIPQPCERCGHAINVQAHHEDYSKPLDVIWLCPPCHGVRHREINEERRSAAA